MTPRELKALYAKGVNLSELLRKKYGLTQNNDEINEITYDLQTGSYISAMGSKEYKRYKQDFTSELAKTILKLGGGSTILEAGVGEATTLSGVLEFFGSDAPTAYGFDLSWSRIAYARKWLHSQNISIPTMCTGSLLHIPFSDNSIDIVYTAHSIEPNGGNEKPILRELFRVTRKFLILLEPGYELAGKEARERMASLGYCKKLKETSENLGFDVLEHKLFPFIARPLNPTALTIIKKCTTADNPKDIFACPKYKTPLEKVGDYYYCPEALSIYPIIEGIPCLRIENAILASKFPEISSNMHPDFLS